jgi:hypothetical protein
VVFNLSYNNEAENVVFLWINKRTGKTMVNVQANPNRTYSSNKSGTTGKITKVSQKSKNYKENWIFDAKKTYEHCMNNPSEARTMSEGFSQDWDVDTFKTIVIYFTNEQEGFDFRNQLFGLLNKHDITYNSTNTITSRINPTQNTPRHFDILDAIDKSLAISTNSLALKLTKFFYNLSGDDFYSEELEDTSKNNNEYTREVIAKMKLKTTTLKMCKHCQQEVTTSGVCNTFHCDYSGEKVETYQIEAMR